MEHCGHWICPCPVSLNLILQFDFESSQRDNYSREKASFITQNNPDVSSYLSLNVSPEEARPSTQSLLCYRSNIGVGFLLESMYKMSMCPQRFHCRLFLQSSGLLRGLLSLICSMWMCLYCIRSLFLTLGCSKSSFFTWSLYQKSFHCCFTLLVQLEAVVHLLMHSVGPLVQRSVSDQFYL